MKKTPPTNHFPSKLHELLDEAESKGHADVISWCEDGKSFRIHNPNAMIPVVTAYFRQTRYKSLLRQLQGYNFKRITSGENKGNVSHPLFVRGKPELCLEMKRKQKASKDENKKSKAKQSANTNQTSSSSQRQGPPIRIPPITQSSTGSDVKRLESTFQNALSQKALFPAPSLVGDHAAGHPQRRASTGMDALRVEIGCTFSSSKNKNLRKKSARSSASSMKRRASAPPLQTSSSAPMFESGRHSKRQRSFEGNQLRHSFHPSALPSYKNASFPFSSMPEEESGEDDILAEEKLQFQKIEQETQKQKEFQQLEKLCFSNMPQGPGAQQFQHSHHSSSVLGSLDLDISLTTTTTTVHHNGADPEVSSSTICNKFVLPSLLEPTPILSPKRRAKTAPCTPNDGFTLNCNIEFPKDPSNFQEIDLKLPSEKTSQLKPFECDSLGLDSGPEPIESSAVSDEIASDEIDEGITEFFGDDAGVDNAWEKVTFESDSKLDGDEEEDLVAWTKGIVYEGGADCVLEPEKFNTQVRGLLSGGTKQEQQLQQQRLLLQQQQQQHRQLMMLKQQQQQQQMGMNQLSMNIRLPQRNMTAHQTQFQAPFALLSKPIPPMHQHRFPTQTQIQQLKR